MIKNVSVFEECNSDLTHLTIKSASKTFIKLIRISFGLNLSSLLSLLRFTTFVIVYFFSRKKFNKINFLGSGAYKYTLSLSTDQILENEF